MSIQDVNIPYGPLAARPAASALGDGALWIDPSQSHALYQVQSENWVKIGVGTAAPPAPAGAATLYGPYVVDYTDIPHDGDKKTLWTPQVGDVLLRLMADPLTGVTWDHGQLFVGPHVDGTVSPAHNCFALTDTAGVGGIDILFHAEVSDSSGSVYTATGYVFKSADPVQVQLAQTSGTNPTQGHVELYALIARAVAPT